MAIYSYPQSKVIDEVTFKKTPNGAVRAYLHVRDGVDLATVGKALDTLQSSNYDCVPFTLGEKPTLEVRGFKADKKLLTTLSTNKLIEDKPVINKEDEDNISWKDWLGKRTLQASGAAYLVGDIGFFTNGVKGKDKLIVAGALSYFLGTLSLLFYGRNDQSDLQVHDLAKQLEDFLAQEKIKIPEGSAMHAIAQEKQKTFLETLDEFARRNPSEIFNTVTAIAGIFVASSAVKNRLFKSTIGMDARAISEMRKVGWLDLGLGSITALSGTFATIVKEKKHDPDSPPKTGLAWLWEKIREHPLAIAGGGYTIATMCHAASTFKDYKEHKRLGKEMGSIYGRGLFVGMAMLSEFLLSISSKGHGEGVVSDESVDTSVIAIAAELIVRQQVEQQEKLIEQMGTFLGQQEELAMEDSKVLSTLRQQVDALRNNPWAKAAAMGITPAAPPVPNVIVEPAKEEPPVWQAKMTTRDAREPQAQLAV